MTPHHADDAPATPHEAFDPQWWEEHYREHGSGPALPGPQLVAEVAGLPPGSALDAGCGNGAGAVWLAQQGWAVTAVDVSATVVAQARGRAEGEEGVADRSTWVVADLVDWVPPRAFDLVVSQYVHPTVPFGRFVARLAEAVAPGGTLVVVGHDHADEHSARHAPTSPAVGLEAMTAPLGEEQWQVETAETRSRPRPTHHGADPGLMHDVVLRARRVG